MQDRVPQQDQLDLGGQLVEVSKGIAKGRVKAEVQPVEDVVVGPDGMCGNRWLATDYPWAR